MKRSTRSGVLGAPTFLAMVFLVGCGNPSPAGQAQAGTAGAGAGGDGQPTGAAGSDAGSEPFACSGDAVESAMIPVPGGAFTMGCNAPVDQNCAADEDPMRSVTLTAFE